MALGRVPSRAPAQSRFDEFRARKSTGEPREIGGVSRERFDKPVRRRRRRTSSFRTFIAGALLIGAAGLGFNADGLSLDSMKALVPGSSCDIKGNISVNTGERIYHVPGQEYYRKTIISTGKGERWFCSEEEARRAGWRKAKR